MIIAAIVSVVFMISGYLLLYDIDWRIAVGVGLVAAGIELTRQIEKL